MSTGSLRVTHGMYGQFCRLSAAGAKAQLLTCCRMATNSAQGDLNSCERPACFIDHQMTDRGPACDSKVFSIYPTRSHVISATQALTERMRSGSTGTCLEATCTCLGIPSPDVLTSQVKARSRLQLVQLEVLRNIKLGLSALNL